MKHSNWDPIVYSRLAGHEGVLQLVLKPKQIKGITWNRVRYTFRYIMQNHESCLMSTGGNSGLGQCTIKKSKC